MKRVLLTGSTGFIGRNLRERMASDYEILAPPRGELDLLDDDAVARYFRRRIVDAVVHCATTPGHRNAPPDSVAFKNLRMFANLLREEGRWGRLIYFGSGAEYDIRRCPPRVTESFFGAHVPADEGGFSKYLISRMAERWERIVVLRPFGVFGKYEDYEIRFISNALCKAIFGRPITIKQNRRFDYVFVEDLPRVVGHFIENEPRQKAYNVCSGSPVELVALAEMVLEAVGTRVDVLVSEPGMGPEFSGDNARLKAELGELRWTPMREAIAALHRWYREHLDRIRPAALAVDK